MNKGALIVWRPGTAVLVEVRWHCEERRAPSEGALIGYGIIGRGGLWNAYELDSGNLRLISDGLISTDAVLSAFSESAAVARNADGRETKTRRPKKTTRSRSPSKG